MKAVVITQPGGPEVLQLKDYPTPVPKGNEVLIAVKAAGLNHADLSQRRGNYPAPDGVPKDIPGMEVAGIVAACGPNVQQWKAGDKVCALIGGGGYAEFAVAPEGQCLPVPKGFDFMEAASLPETVFTVWSNVFERGALKERETLLVHGGSSGIGITALQIAKAFGCKVAVTVGTDEKGEKCKELGADIIVNYKKEDFEQVLLASGVDVILDMIGGDYFPKNCNILRTDGRLVYINATAKEKPVIDIRQVMNKRLVITGSTLRGQPYAFKKQLAGQVQKYVWPFIETGKFRPVVYAVLPLADAAAAHRLLEEGSHVGKVILQAV